MSRFRKATKTKGQSACCAGRPDGSGKTSPTWRCFWHAASLAREARSPSSTRSARAHPNTPMTSPRSTPSTSTTLPGEYVDAIRTRARGLRLPRD